MKALIKITSIAIALFFSMQVNAQNNYISIFEGNGNSEINNLTTDKQGNIIAAGFYDGSIDLNPGQSILNQTSSGINNGFLVKTNSQGDLIWAKNFAGPAQVYANSVTTDDSNNIYVTGIYEGYLAFDNNTLADTIPSAGEFDIFVFKYAPSGNLLWTRRVGDSLKELSPVIHAGKDGFIYLTASFEGTVDFSSNGISNSRTCQGQQDIFILKMDAQANSIWVKQIEGVDYKYSGGISTDAQGNVFTTGSFASTVNFDQGNSSAVNKSSNGGTDIFIAKYTNSGDLAWVNQIGSFGFDIGTTVALDQNSNVIASGSFSATADFDVSSNTVNLNSNGSRDIYITKLDSSGNLTWANSVGGSGLDLSAGLFVNSQNDILVTGRFINTVDFDPGIGTTNLTSVGFSDIYLLKLNGTGMLLNSFSMGGTNNDFGNSVAESPNGNLVLGGSITDSAIFHQNSSNTVTNSGKGAFLFSLANLNVGIESNNFEKFITNIRNITSYEFYLELATKEPLQADLFDLGGRLIQSFNIKDRATFGLNLAKGTYLLKLSDNRNQQTIKLFKQ